MRKTKKVLSLIIVFVMMLTLVVPGFQKPVMAAEGDETKSFLKTEQEFTGSSVKMIADKSAGDDMSFYANQVTATWSARFKTTSSNLMAVMGLSDAFDGTNYISLYLMSGNKIGVEIKKGTENAHYSKVIPTANLANGFNDGQWHTLTLLVTESSYIFYIDGLKWTVAQPPEMVFAQNRGINIDSFSVGGLERGEMAGIKNNYYFNGTIKDVTVSNYAWPEDEILAMHNEPVEGGDELGITTESNINDTSRDITIQSVTSPNEYSPDIANNVIDNNFTTVWHTDWYPAAGASRDDHYITMDLGDVCEVGGLRYLPRLANTGTNGNITQYRIQFSKDGETWSNPVIGNWTSTYSWKNTSFAQRQARYVRLYSLNSLSDTGKPLTSAAEIRITGTAPAFVQPILSKTRVMDLTAGAKVSDILLNSLAPEGDYTYALVNGEGAIDNNKFEIDGNVLKTKEALIKGERYNIRIRASHNGHEDEEGHSGEAAFVIRATGDGLVLEMNEEQTIIPGKPIDLSNDKNADAIKQMDEGTIIVQYTSTNDDLVQSLFAASNSTTGNQNRHFHMYIQPNETIGSEIRNDTTFNYNSIKVPNTVRRMYNKNFAKNTVAFKADKENGQYKIFVNGRLAHTVDANTLGGYKFISDIAGVDTITLGSVMRAGTPSYNFGGTIHNAKVYELALSDEEIIAITNETNYSGKDQIFSSIDGLNCGYYRIPSLLTLSDGTVVSAIDARFGGTHDSPNNIDIAFARSKDGGKTWSKPTMPLYFDDFADTMIDLPAGLQVRNQQSASFIDPVMFEDAEIGRLFLVADAFVAGAGSPQAQVGNGFKEINGKKYMMLKKAGESGFNYTIRENNVIWNDTTNTATEYSINNNLEILHNGQPLTVKQKDVEFVNNTFVYKTTDKDVKMNIFYSDAIFQVYNTAYIYMKYSDDQGQTWSDPIILNPMIKSENIRQMVVGPGRGLQLKNGEHKGRLILPLYQSQGCDLAYSDDHGITWHYLDGPTGGIAATMSESQLVEMPDGSLKVFARAGNKIGTATSTDGGKTWSDGVAVPGISAPGVGSQISVINYDGLIDGKEAIILSTPTGTVRRGGQLKIGLITDTGVEGVDRYSIDWTYSMKVHGDSVAYGYSCLTQLPNNNIGILFEKYDSYTSSELHGRDAMIYEEYSLSELRGGDSVTVTTKVQGQGAVSKSNNVMPGTEVTIVATAAEGYEFKGWKNEDGEIVSTDPSYTFIVNEDCKLTAVFEIKQVVDKTVLQDLVNEVKALDSKLFTANSWKQVEVALATADNVLSNENASQEEIDKAKDDLLAAVDKLVKIEIEGANKTALSIAIKVAENADLENVIPIVVEEFNTALLKAREVNSNNEATQKEVDDAFNRLAKVMHMLEFFKGDKAALKAFIDQVNGLTASEYTDTTWEALQSVLKLAASVYDDENVMQEEVDETYTKLVKAFLDLRLKPNKDMLEELISKADKLNITNYTNVSWSGMVAVLNEVKAVYENPNATVEEVKQAEKALVKALASLEVKSETTVENNTNIVKTGDTTVVATKTGDTASLMYSLTGLTIATIVFYKNKKKKIN